MFYVIAIVIGMTIEAGNIVIVNAIVISCSILSSNAHHRTRGAETSPLQLYFTSPTGLFFNFSSQLCLFVSSVVFSQVLVFNAYFAILM